MCFHPLSSVTLATMDHVDIVKVIDKWLAIYAEMKTRHEWVQIFENKGAIMGCSNPHPHCQIWSCDFLPDLIDKKNKAQQKFARKHSGKTLLVEYLNRELTCGERVVCENENWAVLVPYWAIWPFETMILPKRHIVRLDELTRVEVDTLAQLMKQLLVKYDNLFECEFPYSMGFHFAPSGRFLNEDMSHWQLHLSYVPPLLRSAEVKKFMVGFELLAQPQRDLTPEKAAAQLRELSGSVHYSQKGNES
jgi:UDPglucose--hexose-1-phosphate uridylyltransferase